MEVATLDDNVSAPYIAHIIQRSLTETLQDPDPYQSDKDYYNQEMLKLEAEMLRMRDSYSDPFAAALKLAAAGNIIDFGPGYDLSRDSVLQVVKDTLAVDHPSSVLEALRDALESGTTLLYLGDNTGEIVFDKIFIATIREYYPHLQIYFATRGKPIINDITEEDAYLVGIDQIATVINNGTGIPGTVLEYCSPEFRRIFNYADVILSKGQGNFESLYGSGKKNLFYLFLCKCSLFIERLGAKPNDLILIKEC